MVIRRTYKTVTFNKLCKLVLFSDETKCISIIRIIETSFPVFQFLVVREKLVQNYTTKPDLYESYGIVLMEFPKNVLQSV